MTRRLPILAQVLVTLTFSACITASTGPGIDIAPQALYQVPGCGNLIPAKTGLQDSCFTADFNDDLDVSWCLPGNCCPDSNRFALSSSIQMDTIVVAVQDTAPNSCRCICSYTLRARYTALPLDRYVFIVRLDDSVYYDEIVTRTNARKSP